MGLLAGYFGLRTGIPQHMRLFLTTGVLGGFTTFSAFSLDAALLIERHAYWACGSLYVAASMSSWPRGLVRRPPAYFDFGAFDPLNIDLIPVGDNPPESLNVVIEVPGRRRAGEV